MKPSDKSQFARLITDVMAFYRQDVSKFALTVWWSACERYDMEQVSKALSAHVMDPDKGVYAPKPADMVRQLDGTFTDRALVAWGKLMEGIQRIGQYQDAIFDDPAIHKVVDDLGGWIKICRTEMKELSYLQHRFCESHRTYTSRGNFDYPKRLTGDRSPDEVFARRGLPPPRAGIVGEVAKAQLVYRDGNGGQGGVRGVTFLAIESLSSGLKLIGNLPEHVESKPDRNALRSLDVEADDDFMPKFSNEGTTNDKHTGF